MATLDFTYKGIILSGRVPEANIQAEFYRLCRKYGIEVLLEITHKGCRFDAVVFLDNRPFAIVEVKNYTERRASMGLSTKGRQLRKYSQFGLPVIGVLNSRQVTTSIDRILKMIEEAKNPPLQ